MVDNIPKFVNNINEKCKCTFLLKKACVQKQ
jgi:hypothetical protein